MTKFFGSMLVLMFSSLYWLSVLPDDNPIYPFIIGIFISSAYINCIHMIIELMNMYLRHFGFYEIENKLKYHWKFFLITCVVGGVSTYVIVDAIGIPMVIKLIDSLSLIL